MIGILLLTHGALGEALIAACAHVLGQRPPQLATLGVAAEEAPAQLLPQAQRLCAALDSGAGVLVLTDIYGATPANLALQLVLPGRVEAVAGLSLPMLLRVLTYRDKSDIETVTQKAVDGGRDGVLHMKSRD